MSELNSAEKSVVGKRLLVVGCGDLGIPLATRFHQQGAEVWGLRRDVSKLPALIHPLAADVTVAKSLSCLQGLHFDSAVISLTPGEFNDERYRQVFVEGLANVLGVPTWVPRPATLLRRRSTSVMRDMMDGVIRERTSRPPGTDLLDLMRAASDPDTGRQMTPEELRDNMLAFIVAGHETTALALAWSIYLLALDPAAQDRAREEAEVRDRPRNVDAPRQGDRLARVQGLQHGQLVVALAQQVHGATQDA